MGAKPDKSGSSNNVEHKFPFENHYTALIRWRALVVLAWLPVFTNPPSNGASQAKGYLLKPQTLVNARLSRTCLSTGITLPNYHKVNGDVSV